ncbi:MAG: Gfo/Idh/MocA family oxidoreductase [Sedimentisphaerales bacterium]|nr:Gfo/Idh/MocA family oxidoreductase [Sedimentisphaerales bacterium]
MATKDKITRRRFIGNIGGSALAALGIPYVIPSFAAGFGDEVTPSEKITLGFIGVGMQGRFLLSQILQRFDCQVVALCDVDKQKLERGLEMVRENYAEQRLGCTGYHDFRELLARDDIDAVVIAAPEHWHGVMAIEACRRGMDVYCEKPLALSIDEARQIVNAARRYERVFQTGSMQRSDYKFRRACELVRNGYIGEVKNIRVGIKTSSFPMYPVACDLPAEPTPSELDWDMWLGPAQWRPYNSRIAPPIDARGWPHWRDYEEYAGGIMTDWGAHHFDIAQWGLGMDESGPVEVYPENGKDIRQLTYRYSNGITMVRDDSMNYKAIVFTGTRGEVEVSREFLNTRPETLTRLRFGSSDTRLYESDDHYGDWLDCIRSRQRPICDVETGCRSLTVCHLGIIAHRLGRPLKWDPVKERFIGDEEANRLLSRTMRSPWRV